MGPPALNLPALVAADALLALTAVPTVRATMASRMHHRRTIQTPWFSIEEPDL
jgi:hypothetical protein